MIIQPIVLGYALDKGSSEQQYRLVFSGMIGISVVGTLVFVIFGTSARQMGDYSRTEEQEENENTPLV